MFLSIMGMYEHDHTVFKGLKVPDGVDLDTVIIEICLQCAELEIVYPNIDTMKLAITAWSIANAHTWEKLYKTMNLEYNPIWNVDADITRTDKTESDRDIARDQKMSGTNKDTPNLTDTESVKGFNSNTWAESRKTTRTGTDTFTSSNTDTENINEKRTDDNVFTERRTGNIGVTTTQQMIQAERDIAQFSIINYIVQSFKERFCLLIY